MHLLHHLLLELLRNSLQLLFLVRLHLAGVLLQLLFQTLFLVGQLFQLHVEDVFHQLERSLFLVVFELYSLQFSHLLLLLNLEFLQLAGELLHFRVFVNGQCFWLEVVSDLLNEFVDRLVHAVDVVLHFILQLLRLQQQLLALFRLLLHVLHPLVQRLVIVDLSLDGFQVEFCFHNLVSRFALRYGQGQSQVLCDFIDFEHYFGQDVLVESAF